MEVQAVQVGSSSAAERAFAQPSMAKQNPKQTPSQTKLQ